MKTNVKIDYINYEPKIHSTFPVIKTCKIYSKNGIINLYVEANRLIDELSDDIGYDNEGKYIAVTIGQWHHAETGEKISNEEFYDLSELEVYEYDFVSAVIKIYVDKDYRACYHNDFNNKIMISFIPYDIINFSDSEADNNPFIYKLV